MYSKIAVAVDGTQESLRAVREAVRMAMRESTVTLVTVIPVLVYSDADFDPVRAHGDEQTRMVAPAMKILDEAGIRSELVMLHGRPADEVARYVNETGVDLLVVGTRSLGRMQALMLGGSVSKRLTQQADCNVLLVK